MTSDRSHSNSGVLSRAQGCLLGQLIGDSLGSLVEFQTPERIRSRYPDGVRDMADGGTFNTIAGQPTDDSEMALLLARSLASNGTFDRDDVQKAYVYWLDSDPFDVGSAIFGGLRGRPISSSQANGAMMRISPLGIFGANYALDQVAEWARQDATITHIHRVCKEANALFAMAIAQAVRTGCDASDLYRAIEGWAEEMDVDNRLRKAVAKAAESPPDEFIHQQGWVLIAFPNALWQLLHAESVEEGIVDTIMQGGDTDTNAAICGALLGAVYGREAIPERWIETIQNCRPQAGTPGVRKPRPEVFWPADALELAEQLVAPTG
ncbi:MAG: ADP-ribosylglycohydrolase family protein [Caldilineaceae bacterium]|nr:ADP-ribosylglycohydrolase family protein [Caldilineaceae bacterium]